MSPARASGVVADVPLVDPDRDLVVVPGARGSGDGLVARAFRDVEAAVARRRLTIGGSDTVDRDDMLFPVGPAVTVLHPDAEAELRRRVHVVVRCLRRVVRRYAGDPRLQEFLAVPEVLRRWIVRHPDPRSLTVDYCRLDVLGNSLGTARVLEFNASSPGGVVLSGVVNRLWRESALAEVLGSWRLPPAPFEHRGWFADWLLDHGRRHGVPEDDTRPVGLFHALQSSKHEFAQICAQLRARGREPVELQPSDVARSREMRLGYLKYIPIEPAEVKGWDDFCARMTSGDLVVPNALAERWIAENKLCLAVLSDPRFRDLFTPAEQAALDALVPRSRKLGDGMSPAEAVAQRGRLVLKQPYSHRGESVVIGADTPAEHWSFLVRDPGHRGWLVQERVEPFRLDTPHGPCFRDLVVPVLDGRVIGYGSRLSHNPVLNVARGGQVPAVFTPHPLDPAGAAGHP
uniref:hypothetical protein n=1 Tax=Saccharothrix mutabilis TaxID=33921 RepID=UPI0031D1B33C